MNRSHNIVTQLFLMCVSMASFKRAKSGKWVMPSWHDLCPCVWHGLTLSLIRGHDLFSRVTWLTHILLTHTCLVRCLHDIVTWLIHMCVGSPTLTYVDMTHSHVWYDSLTYDSFAASMTSWHDSFTCVCDHSPLSHTWTWFILTCDMTHSHMTRSLSRWHRDMTHSHVCGITHSHIRGHDSFSLVTWLNHTFARFLDDVVTWLILTRDMTHSHMTCSLPQ